MRVLTWNVAGRVGRQPEQAAAVAAVEADVVALQEVTARTLPLWRAALAVAGFTSIEAALTPVSPGGRGGATPVSPGARRGATPPARAPGRRLLGVLTAARATVARLDGPEVPWPERVLACAVGHVEIVNVHSPIAPAPDLAKVRTHEAVAAYLEGRSPPIVLCGDLNTPRRELPDGDVLTFAHASNGRLRPERGERWDQAERALVHGLRQRGWVDAFRELHGYEHREASWTFSNDRGGWRLDHLLATGLTPTASAYAHDWRRAGLSDHSALVADLA